MAAVNAIDQIATPRIEGDLEWQLGTLMEKTVVGPCCIVGQANSGGYRRAGGPEVFGRGEVGAKDGEGLGEGEGRKMRWPGLHLTVSLSSRHGRACLEVGGKRRKPVGVEIGREVVV